MVTIVGTAGDDSLAGAEGLDHVDTLYGLDGDDLLVSTSGNDTLVGGNGADTFDAGGPGGKTVLSYAQSDSPVSIEYYSDGREIDENGEPRVVFNASGGEAEGDQIINTSHIYSTQLGLIGSDGDDSFTGTLFFVEGGKGADTITIDPIFYTRPTVSYAHSDAGVSLDMNDGLGHGGDAEGDQVSVIDEDGRLEIIGSDFDDNLVAAEDSGFSAVGGAGDDRLIGGSQFNQFDGGTGDDYMLGNQQGDEFLGGPGADYMDGAGNIDLLSYANSSEGVELDLRIGVGHGGDAEGDTILNIEKFTLTDHDDVVYLADREEGVAQSVFGGEGVDTIYGSAGGDRLTGETLYGGDGHDSLSVYSGRDVGDSEDNYLNGGDGRDNLTADGIGNDILIGGAGNDSLNAGLYDRSATGNATLFGGSGDDSLSSYGGGSDTLLGGSGDDIIEGGNEDDVLDGGSGYDLFRPQGYQGEQLYIDLMENEIHGSRYEGTVIKGFEDVIGTGADDTLLATNEDDDLRGLSGDDVLYGRDGDDFIRGDGGNDLLEGQNGRDRLDGSTGGDTLRGGDGHDVLQGGYGSDTLEGGDGNDYLIGDVHYRFLHSSSDTFLWDEYEGGAERDRIVDFQIDENGIHDRVQLSENFQDQSGIHDFRDFLQHAEQNDTGVYVDFANGSDYDYGVQIDGITLDELGEEHVFFGEDTLVG
ncbi:calcium-binding protein [Thalassospira marina]|uniref:Calcium-binding protein n=1 Tax=Thalassospira marina TaxID=2048283 RepID=A0ABN5FBV6_9PROT|nr:calcium-binding protein [Thalassospira marina]AUG51796.1 hypothetical protein CSC3H3_03000 [Thalassospira marina]